MEKHIKIFCEKKPTIEVKCDVCNKSMKIKTSELLKVKYEYKGTCPHCGATFSCDTRKIHKEFEELKRLC